MCAQFQSYSCTLVFVLTSEEDDTRYIQIYYWVPFGRSGTVFALIG